MIIIITVNNFKEKFVRAKFKRELAIQIPCYSEGLVIYFYDNY